MPSLRARLFTFVLRHRHLLRPRAKRRDVIDWNTSIPDLRRDIAKAVRLFGKVRAGIEIRPERIDGLYAEWVIPPGAGSESAILYFHGGGYVMGSCENHRVHVAKFATGSRTRALLFDYRLAPEHPFPAALEDSIAAYRWLLAQGVSPLNIAFMGDSAGGGLCLAALLTARDRGMPMPSAAVALSPWTDLKCTGESYRTKAGVCLGPKGSWTVFAKYYAGESDPGLPLISPVYGDLHGLPPVLIYAGEDEVLRDDSICFAAQAKEAGVDVSLRIGPGMFHCYPVCGRLFPEAGRAMDEICSFIKDRIEK